MKNYKLRLAAFALAFAGITSSAQAGEGTFGWIYTLDLQPKGTLEFEQRLQYKPRTSARQIRSVARPYRNRIWRQ
ncbi:MAG: hypothetical protein WBJ21_01955 [Burkholderiaceae bacterium]